MARVEVVCEIEADGSVKIEVEASDPAVCAAEAAALRERLSGKRVGNTAPRRTAEVDARQLDVAVRKAGR